MEVVGGPLKKIAFWTCVLQ